MLTVLRLHGTFLLFSLSSFPAGSHLLPHAFNHHPKSPKVYSDSHLITHLQPSISTRKDLKCILSKSQTRRLCHPGINRRHTVTWLCNHSTWQPGTRGVISPMSLSSLLRIKPIASVLPFYLWNTPPASTPQPLSPSEPKATTRQPPRGFPASCLASPNPHMMGNSWGILNSKHSITPTDNSAWPHQRHQNKE